MTSLPILSWLSGSVLSLGRHAHAAWKSQSTTERITTVFLGVMIAGGLLIRIQGLGSPITYTFDEVYFVHNAQNYAVGLADTNDHPPLGKLLIAVGMVLFGFNSVGWRFIPLCFGLQTIVLAYWAGLTTFQNGRAGWMAAAFVAADGFFISYSRSALLDGIMVCFVIWSFVAAVTAETWRGVVASAILIGLATSVKWSGVFAVIPAATVILMHRRVPPRALLWLGLAPLVHILISDGRVGSQRTIQRSLFNLESHR